MKQGLWGCDGGFIVITIAAVAVIIVANVIDTLSDSGGWRGVVCGDCCSCGNVRRNNTCICV